MIISRVPGIVRGSVPLAAACLLTMPAAASVGPELSRPQSRDIAAWLPLMIGERSRNRTPRRVDASNIFDYMDGAGEMYLGYRFDHLDVYEYTGPGGTILVDALYPLCDKGPQPNPRYRWLYKGLVGGTDPVAVESVCLRIITEKRRALRGEPWPLNPPPLCVEAAERVDGLGRAERRRSRSGHRVSMKISCSASDRPNDPPKELR